MLLIKLLSNMIGNLMKNMFLIQLRNIMIKMKNEMKQMNL